MIVNNIIDDNDFFPFIKFIILRVLGTEFIFMFSALMSFVNPRICRVLAVR